MWTGKLLGFLIGLAIAGPVGALIGVILGHLYDKSRVRIYRGFDPTKRAHVENTFFVTVFPLLGHIAKADGRVSEAEIADTEQLMSRMRLPPADRQRAIELFKEGTEPDFDIIPLLDTFNRECGIYINLKQILLVYLISLALADGHLKEAEKRVLEDVADILGFSAAAFNHILRMAIAQSHFYHYGQAGSQEDRRRTTAGKDEVSTAYEALGVSVSVSDAELKKAYRRLMSEYHPDKLSGRGVPDEMIEIATERAQEIQAAYDVIKKKRGI